MSRSGNEWALASASAAAIASWLLLGVGAGRADGLKIGNVAVAPRDATTAAVKFDISWENSWRHGSVHDAAWVFFKVQADPKAPWQHVRLAADKVLNPTGYGQAEGGTRLDFIVPDGGEGFTGLFVRQVAEARSRALAGQDFFMTADLSPLYRQENNGKDLPLASHFNCSSIRPGELSCNATRVEWLDGTAEEDLTKAEIVCRRQVRALHEFLRRRVDGFENSRLIETAPQIGVRESRIIVADHVVTEEDCRKAVKCEDPIFRAQVAFDLHNPGKYTCEVLKDDQFTPYRALLTKGLENLMVIGRAMSSDHVANSATRQMFRVFTIGEVAGLAAALTVRKNVTPRALPYAELRAGMIERGIRFE